MRQGLNRIESVSLKVERMDSCIEINTNFQKKHEEMITSMRITMEKLDFEKACVSDLDTLKETVRVQIFKMTAKNDFVNSKVYKIASFLEKYHPIIV